MEFGDGFVSVESLYLLGKLVLVIVFRRLCSVKS